MTLTLPEELLLLALDPVKGRPLCGNRFLEYGLAGAALAELELQGRVAEERGRVAVVNPIAPPGDPVLAVVLSSLPAPGKSRFANTVSARRWIRSGGREVEGLYLDRLVERGELRRQSRRVLGLFPVHRHPAGDTDRAAALRARFARAHAAGFPDARDRLLAAFVAAIDLSGALVPGGRRARGALRALIRDEWAPYAVHRNVRADKARQGGNGGGDGGGGSGGGD